MTANNFVTALIQDSSDSETDFGAGAGAFNLPFQTALADITAADLVTGFTPGYNFKIVKSVFVVSKPATTAAKAATVGLKIGSTAVTGGVLSLTSANMTPKGVVVAATAITAANTGTSTDTLSIVGSAVTAFVEGNGSIVLTIQNTDVPDLRAELVERGILPALDA